MHRIDREGPRPIRTAWRRRGLQAFKIGKAEDHTSRGGAEVGAPVIGEDGQDDVAGRRIREGHAPGREDER